MAMTTNNSSGPKSDINVTPLVDVMLVLLIIFMITAPLMTHRIQITLPSAVQQKEDTRQQPEPMDLAVKEDGTMYLNDNAITAAELKNRFAVAANRSPQPELQIRADKNTPYRLVRNVLGDAKDAGMVHVGFMTTIEE